MKFQAINFEGKKTVTVELSEKIFSLKPNFFLYPSVIKI